MTDDGYVLPGGEKVAKTMSDDDRFIPSAHQSYTYTHAAAEEGGVRETVTTELGGETRVTDPETGGEKGTKPQRMDLLPWDTLMAIAAHYGVGAEKYEDRNWERGYAWHLTFAAMQRHLATFWQGEDFDEETGSHHLAAACFHALALYTFVLRGIGTDDRPMQSNDLKAPRFTEERCDDRPL